MAKIDALPVALRPLARRIDGDPVISKRPNGVLSEAELAKAEQLGHLSTDEMALLPKLRAALKQLSGESARHVPMKPSSALAALGPAVTIVETAAVGANGQPQKPKPRVLVIDVGGTNVKMRGPDGQETRFASGRGMSPGQMVEQVKQLTAGWTYDVISIGYPGVVKDDRVSVEPRNLGPGWKDFDFGEALGKPVKLLNDAAMQALGSATTPGLTLFMGVGTGLGVALVEVSERPGGELEKRVIATELGHAHAADGREYEAMVGRRGLEGEDGQVSPEELIVWTAALQQAVGDLQRMFDPDTVVIGGGNVKRFADFRAVFPDERVKTGDNDFAFEGGQAMWGA